MIKLKLIKLRARSLPVNFIIYEKTSRRLKLTIRERKKTRSKLHKQRKAPLKQNKLKK